MFCDIDIYNFPFELMINQDKLRIMKKFIKLFILIIK